MYVVLPFRKKVLRRAVQTETGRRIEVEFTGPEFVFGIGPYLDSALEPVYSCRDRFIELRFTRDLATTGARLDLASV